MQAIHSIEQARCSENYFMETTAGKNFFSIEATTT
jgi:hypothetical protein